MHFSFVGPALYVHVWTTCVELGGTGNGVAPWIWYIRSIVTQGWPPKCPKTADLGIHGNRQNHANPDHTAQLADQGNGPKMTDHIHATYRLGTMTRFIVAQLSAAILPSWCGWVVPSWNFGGLWLYAFKYHPIIYMAVCICHLGGLFC